MELQGVTCDLPETGEGRPVTPFTAHGTIYTVKQDTLGHGAYGFDGEVCLPAQAPDATHGAYSR